MWRRCSGPGLWLGLWQGLWPGLWEGLWGIRQVCRQLFRRTCRCRSSRAMSGLPMLTVLVQWTGSSSMLTKVPWRHRVNASSSCRRKCQKKRINGLIKTKKLWDLIRLNAGTDDGYSAKPVNVTNWPQLKWYLDLISGLQSLPFAEQMEYSLIWVKRHTHFSFWPWASAVLQLWCRDNAVVDCWRGSKPPSLPGSLCSSL